MELRILGDKEFFVSSLFDSKVFFLRNLGETQRLQFRYFQNPELRHIRSFPSAYFFSGRKAKKIHRFLPVQPLCSTVSSCVTKPHRLSSSSAIEARAASRWTCRFAAWNVPAPGAADGFPWEKGLWTVPTSLGVGRQLAHATSQRARYLHNNDIIPYRHRAHVVSPQ